MGEMEMHQDGRRVEQQQQQQQGPKKKKTKLVALLNSFSSKRYRALNYPPPIPQYDGADRLSALPDDVIYLILSRLKLKEAAWTSILSHRWRNVWKHTGSLVFHCPDKDAVIGETSTVNGEFRIVPQPKFVQRVNRVLSLHRSPAIVEFSISGGLFRRIRDQLVDEWVEFALRKRVKKLMLDFSGKVKTLSGSYSLTKPLLQKYSLDSLSVLCLKRVEVTSEVLDHLLLKCHLLEVLCVEESSSLQGLNIPGPLPKLRSVELKNCCNLRIIQIHAINIESFSFVGYKIPVTFEQVPNLVEFSLVGSYSPLLFSYIARPSIYLSHLISLTLEARSCTYPISKVLHEFPVLQSLRQLTLEGVLECIVDCCEFLLKRCPMLGKLILKADAISRIDRYGDWIMKEESKCLHSCITEFELFEFFGIVLREEETVVFRSIVKNLPSLKRVIIHPRFEGLQLVDHLIRVDVDKFTKELNETLASSVEFYVG